MGTTGLDEDYHGQDKHDRIGIIPRAIEDIFAGMAALGGNCQLKVSFLELYQEVSNDQFYNLVGHFAYSR